MSHPSQLIQIQMKSKPTEATGTVKPHPRETELKPKLPLQPVGSRLHFVSYFTTRNMLCLLFALPSLEWHLQMGGERWMQKVVLLLSWQRWEGTRPPPGWDPAIAKEWIPHWGLLQHSDKPPGGSADRAWGHLPEEQGGCRDVLLSSRPCPTSADVRPLWLLISIGVMLRCPELPPSLAAESPLPLGPLCLGPPQMEKNMLITKGGHQYWRKHGAVQDHTARVEVKRVEEWKAWTEK